ncbi:MAG: M3 family peptidase, partial [Rikenellaceae bacterium]|nr:M3 family peptidase [Rikenellaceae bacterium]
MKKQILIAAMALTTLAACQSDVNPLLADWNTPYQTPPFNEIKVEHYAPAFDVAIAEARAEIDAIVADTAAPTFANTIEALERAGSKLTRIEYIFFNIL